MKRKTMLPVLLISICLLSHDSNLQGQTIAISDRPGVAVLLIDTDRQPAKTEVSVYGHFLEHINHSVVDGLFAEQVQGCGFEGNDFETYWIPFGDGKAEVAEVRSENGMKSVRLTPGRGTAGIKQGRIYLGSGFNYSGSVWIKPESGSVKLFFRVTDASGKQIAVMPLHYSGRDWQETGFEFSSDVTDRYAAVEIFATGTGAVLVDFISVMRTDIRNAGGLRPDLLAAMKALRPPFIRWPGGSFASIYKWKDGIGPRVSRKYHPNTIWGGYSDYYGFGTDEFMELCRQLQSEPLIVLSATNTDEQQFRDAMDWIHYLNDPPKPIGEKYAQKTDTHNPIM
jgi:alpha-N-arabinofuranosidase